MKRDAIVLSSVLLCLSLAFIPAFADPASNSTAPPATAEWFDNFVNGILTAAVEGAARFASLAGRTAMRIISAIYGPLALIGVLLWAADVDKQIGKRLILGSIILMIVVEAIPLLGI
jgi:hypothetical protein